MSDSNVKWIDGLQFSSLYWPPPQDVEQKKVSFLLLEFCCLCYNFHDTWCRSQTPLVFSCLKAQILAYVEYFGQFTADSEQFPEDIAQVPHLLQQFSICCGKMYARCVYLIYPFFFASVQLIQSSYPSKESRLVDEVLGNTNFLWTIAWKSKKEFDILLLLALYSSFCSSSSGAWSCSCTSNSFTHHRWDAVLW